MPGGLFCAIGNPLSDGTWQYEWVNGRQLARIYSVDTDASFVYNENGLRVQKTVNWVITDYTLHGKNIVHMTQVSNTLHFFYDASNKPAIVDFNGTKYAYVHNLQGDIVAILDSNGIAVVQYKYDAWGRQISCDVVAGNSNAAALSTLNPFRYRGYVYDEETGLYYLRSRYFSPTCGRFIISDIIYIRNTYAYCSNSPLILRDDSGYAPTSSVFFAHAIDGGAARTPLSSAPSDGKYYIFTLEEEQRVGLQGYVDISHAKVQPATRDGVTEIYVGLYIGSEAKFEFHFVDRVSGTVYAGRIDASKCVLGDEVGKAEFYFGPEDIENTGSGVRWQSYNIQNAINNMIRKGDFEYGQIINGKSTDHHR